MPRSCQVCSHPLLAQIEKRMLSGEKIKRIHDKMLEEGMSPPPLHSMYRHYKNDLEPITQAKIDSDTVRRQKIAEEIKKSIEQAEIITKNLRLYRTMIEQLETNLDNPKNRRELVTLMGKMENTIELFMKFHEKFKIEEDVKQVDVFDAMIECMHDFPKDLIDKFVERWESKYGRTK